MDTKGWTQRDVEFACTHARQSSLPSVASIGSIHPFPREAKLCLAEIKVRLAEAKVCLAEAKVCLAEAKVCLAEIKVRLAEIKVCLAEAKVCLAEVKVCLAEVKVCLAEAKVCLAEVTCQKVPSRQTTVPGCGYRHIYTRALARTHMRVPPETALTPTHQGCQRLSFTATSPSTATSCKRATAG